MTNRCGGLRCKHCTKLTVHATNEPNRGIHPDPPCVPDCEPPGMTIRVTPGGQYRVNFLSGCESTCLKQDLDDALKTGLAMAAERKAAATGAP